MRAIRTALVVGAACLLMEVGVTPRSKTDFSGSWVLSPQSTREMTGTRFHSVAFSCGDECTIVQTEKALIINHPSDAEGMAPPPLVVNLDGKDTKNQELNRGRAPTRYIPTAVWSGSSLWITRTLDGDERLTTAQVLAIENGRLTISRKVVFSRDVFGGLAKLIYDKKLK
jgi:hypothetical protein